MGHAVKWSLAFGVWYRNLAVYRHTWHMNLLPNFFEPVFYLLGLGLGVGAFVKEGIDGTSYLGFIGPGLMAASAMNGASFETTYSMFVRRMHKIYAAYLCTPVNVADLVWGEVLWATTRALIYGACFYFFLIVFHLLGYEILTNPWGVLAMPFAVATIGLLFAFCGAFFTACITNIELYSYYFTIFLTPLFLFSGTFFPVSTIPYGEIIAWFTPLYHAVRVCRGLTRGPWGMAETVSWIWMLVVSLGLAYASVRVMRRRLIL